MICSRIEDYPVIIYILTVFMLPCCYNSLPKTPTFYEGTKRDIYTPTYQTGIIYNSVFLSIWIFLSPSSTCNFVHTRPSVSVMNGRCSQPPSCFVYTVNISKHLSRQLKHALFHLLLVAMQAQPLSVLKQSSAVAFSLFSLKCAWSWHKVNWDMVWKEKKKRFLFCFFSSSPLSTVLLSLDMTQLKSYPFHISRVFGFFTIICEEKKEKDYALTDIKS